MASVPVVQVATVALVVLAPVRVAAAVIPLLAMATWVRAVVQVLLHAVAFHVSPQPLHVPMVAALAAVALTIAALAAAVPIVAALAAVDPIVAALAAAARRAVATVVAVIRAAVAVVALRAADIVTNSPSSFLHKLEFA